MLPWPICSVLHATYPPEAVRKLASLLVSLFIVTPTVHTHIVVKQSIAAATATTTATATATTDTRHRLLHTINH
jgi:hypothetical protein